MNEKTSASAKGGNEEIARRWWQELRPDATRGRRPRGDPGALAALRRAQTPLDAMLVPAFWELRRRLAGYAGDREWREKRVAVLAIVLAHIREDDPGRTLARAVGWRRLDDKEGALLSELRFRRLIEARTAEELRGEFVRLVRLLKGTANVADCARSLLYWTDWQGRIRRDWAFDYYAAGIAKPDEEEAAAGDDDGARTPEEESAS